MASQCRNSARWTPEEDAMLTRLVDQHNGRDWARISQSFPGRTGKSCRLRWCNQLCPMIDRGPFTREEDNIIIQAHANVGSKWAHIARLLKNRRTDNAIKNRWNSTLRRRDRIPTPPTTNIQVVSPGGPSNSNCYRPVVEVEPYPYPGQVNFNQFYPEGPPFHPIQTGLSLSPPGSGSGGSVATHRSDISESSTARGLNMQAQAPEVAPFASSGEGENVFGEMLVDVTRKEVRRMKEMNHEGCYCGDEQLVHGLLGRLGFNMMSANY